LFDARHRLHKLLLLRLGERGQQGRHLGLRAGVERRERTPAGGREAQVLVAGVGRAARGLDQATLLEAAQQPAQVAGVEIELARQLGGGRPVVVRQFPQQARFGQRELRVQKAFVQHADAACVIAVELADQLDAGGWRGGF
jgi:hypothetical protein